MSPFDGEAGSKKAGEQLCFLLVFHLQNTFYPEQRARPSLFPVANVASQKLTSRRFLPHSGAAASLALSLEGPGCSETPASGYAAHFLSVLEAVVPTLVHWR